MPAVVNTEFARRAGLVFSTAALLFFTLTGCTSNRPPQSADIPPPLVAALRSVTNKYAPDAHVSICRIEIRPDGRGYVLKGFVDSQAARDEAIAAAAKTGLSVDDEIDVLPDKKLGDHVWGIATLSVVNVREKAGNPAEMGTQMLTGESFRVWKKETNWYLVQTGDNYVGWVEGGGFTNCTKADVDRWNAAPHLIVIAYEDRILEKPDTNAMTVSDVVMGSMVERLDDSGDWFKIGLPDGRSGYLPKKSVADYAAWQASRRPTPENIEQTARTFLGRPYVWGCNSIRGMDCSGLTKFVYFLNGIRLDRNASEQAHQGVEVPLDDDLKNLKKGDLLFFGRPARHGRPEWVNHTAIYLGDKMFIQSSEFVRISSLDRESPLSDERRIRGLLHARRILPDTQ